MENRVKFINIVIFSFCCSLSMIQFCSAQNLENIVIARATYSVKFIKNGVKSIDDICILDIGRNQSYFYSKSEVDNSDMRMKKMREAMAKGEPPVFSDDGLIKGDFFKEIIFKKYDPQQTVNIRAIGTTIGYLRTTDLYKNWKISSDTLTINNLLCQKAETAIGENKITAWFCKDLPYHDGPIFSQGLPGLIVKTSSSSGWQVQITKFELNKPLPALIKQLVESYRLVSEDDYKKAIANFNGPRVNSSEIDLPGGVKLKKTGQ